MRLGVICCEIMKPELEKVIAEDPSIEIEHLEYLNFGLHVYPQDLRKTVTEKVASLKGQVDAVFLGYGFCQSLEGIEELFDVPVILPQVEDCIALLLGPRNYANQRAKCAGTWFMTPGWCEQGVNAVIRELRLDTVRNLNKSPMDMCKRLFKSYKRALVIETGAGDPALHEQQAEDFAGNFDLKVEKVPGTTELLQENLAKARKAALFSKSEVT